MQPSRTFWRRCCFADDCENQTIDYCCWSSTLFVITMSQELQFPSAEEDGWEGCLVCQHPHTHAGVEDDGRRTRQFSPSRKKAKAKGSEGCFVRKRAKSGGRLLREWEEAVCYCHPTRGCI